jgi:dCTP deaminase
MVLSDTQILREMHWGRIIVEPYNSKYQNPNSIDLTLNPTCKIYKPHFTEKNGDAVARPATLDCRQDNPTLEFEIPETGFTLQPNTLYLYRVNEKIGVKAGSKLCAKVEGKSSLGRLGLFVHITAGWIDAGFEGSLVLELHCVQPLVIYPNMKIAQICFMRIEGEVSESYGDKKGSKYMLQEGVQASKMHENFKEE